MFSQKRFFSIFYLLFTVSYFPFGSSFIRLWRDLSAKI